MYFLSLMVMVRAWQSLSNSTPRQNFNSPRSVISNSTSSLDLSHANLAKILANMIKSSTYNKTINKYSLVCLMYNEWSAWLLVKPSLVKNESIHWYHALGDCLSLYKDFLSLHTR